MDNRIPIVVGVTGHRDLRDEDLSCLRQAVQRIFAELKALYPATPLVLLSALAEGADRLVARVALEDDIELIVPLPMTLNEYQQDFAGESSRTEFNALLEKAGQYFAVPFRPDGTTGKLPGDSGYRAEKYARMGIYIIHHSQILLALWDGSPSELVGGTAHNVRLRLEGGSESYSASHPLLDPVDRGPVYHIVTPRISCPHPDKPAFNVYKYFPRGWENECDAAAYYNHLLERIDAYNRDPMRE